MIMYLESKLSIAFRTRLVKYLYEMYMKDETVREHAAASLAATAWARWLGTPQQV